MKTLLLTFLLLLSANFLAQTNSTRLLTKTDVKFFIENKGQWNPEVKYLARIGGMNAWITNDGVVYDYYKIEKNYDEAKLREIPEQEREIYQTERSSIKGHVIKTIFAKNNSDKQFSGNERGTAYYNYFIGKDQSKWVNHVRLFGSVTVEELYNGIDARYYFDKGLLRYDFIVKPNADVSQINLTIEGADNFTVSEKGELEIETLLGKVIHKDIMAYQKIRGENKQKVAAFFVKKENGAIGFAVDNYDKKSALVIDPLVYSTYLGGNAEDYGYGIALDDDGNIYTVGYTNSTDFPTSYGAYQTTISGWGDVFVTKFDDSGTNLKYSTFLGGEGWDKGFAIAIDKHNNAYVTGITLSDDFPATDGAFQTNRIGSNDVFVACLNEGGDVLRYSTFLGGTYWDASTSIAVDDLSNAYVTGNTSSADFPVTEGAYQTTIGTSNKIFVTKLNGSGANLAYSTFLGGDDYDIANSIVVDNFTNVYLTGQTSSENFPVSDGAYQTNNNGNNDAFVTKLNASGNNLIYSTYLGGSLSDYGNSIVFDADGNAYITGYTHSLNFPTTVGAFQSNNRGNYDAFIAKFNETGEILRYSTYLGGGSDEHGISIALDDEGNVCITGETWSGDFPVTDGAFQTNYAGERDAFITQLDQTGGILRYSSYLGGAGDETGASIALEGGTNAYIAGYTSSDDFPVTGGAYQTTREGELSAFIAKVDLPLTSAAEDEENMPENFKLFQNYPNPFSKGAGENASTTIKYFVPENSFVKLSIFNILGERVVVPVNAEVKTGYQKLSWNASDLPSGIYLIKIEARGLESKINFTDVKKALLIK